ncbi:UDP-glucose 4-epimerase [Rhodobacteraceae bacterium MBR-64]
MSILITGGAGYIGSHVALDFIQQGRSVVIADNLVTGRKELVPVEATFEYVDIGDEAVMRRVMRDHAVSAVIHCAGSTIVPESVANPLKYYKNNTVASLALLRAMASENVHRIIFSSTAAVYRAEEGEPLAEFHEINPSTPYGMSKWMTEMMIGDVAAAKALDYVILRYFNVAGADPKQRSGQATPEATHLIKVAVEAALGVRQELGIFGTDWPTPDGTGVRDFIHVTDLAKAHRLALTYLEEGGDSQTLNCGYGRGYSVREVVATVRKVCESDFVVSEGPRRPGDLGSVIADPRRLMSLLDWVPEYDSLDVIIQHAVEWERRWSQLQSDKRTDLGAATVGERE